MDSRRVREKDLIEPVLQLIADHRDKYGGLDISSIDRLLRQKLSLSTEDKVILKRRKDDRFSQVVRNLVSHRTLEKSGLAEYKNDGTYKRGAYYLTPKGEAKMNKIPIFKQADLFETKETKMNE